MPQFLDWITRVFSSGESVQDGPPSLLPGERSAVEHYLRNVFKECALDVAASPISFDPVAAIGAAELLAEACWLLVAEEDEPKPLGIESSPSSPSTDLSTDIALRFLPAVYRRAKLHQPEGTLTIELDRILRMWPLSGVLANLDGKPSSKLDFGGHSGLQMLYAERLLETGQPGWVPTSEPARSWVERVFRERGKPLPAYVPEEIDGV
jgi:hypothetical protein